MQRQSASGFWTCQPWLEYQYTQTTPCEISKPKHAALKSGVSLLEIWHYLLFWQVLFPSSRWGVPLLSPRQTVSVVSLRPLRVPRGAAGHSGAALSGVEGRPRQLRPRLAVWWQRPLPGDVASPGLWRERAWSPHCHTQQHYWQHHSSIWCLLLQRYCTIRGKPHLDSFFIGVNSLLVDWTVLNINIVNL